MVIDTSALLAILLQEQDARSFAEAIERDPVRLISAGTILEASIVLLARHGEAGVRDLDLLLHRIDARIEPATAEQMEFGREAFARYGKGRHPAGLNYGDCFSYALSAATGEPLLFKGDDFGRTDLRAALQPT